VGEGALERGYGKVPDKIIGDEDQPIQHTITLKITNNQLDITYVRPRLYSHYIRPLT
jgi:hypothetical protein